MLTYDQIDAIALKAANKRLQKGDSAEAALLYAEKILQFLHAPYTFGVEYIEFHGRELAYLNSGETYNQTICIENNVAFLSSWGDWFEEAEQEHEEETGTIRCACCGKFTDYDNETDWRETVCTHCNHYVDGTSQR